jgi:hypothetical protein
MFCSLLFGVLTVIIHRKLIFFLGLMLHLLIIAVVVHRIQRDATSRLHDKTGLLLSGLIIKIFFG